MTRFVHQRLIRTVYPRRATTEVGGGKSKFSRLPFYGGVKKPARVLQLNTGTGTNKDKKHGPVTPT